MSALRERLTDEGFESNADSDFAVRCLFNTKAPGDSPSTISSTPSNRSPR